MKTSVTKVLTHYASAILMDPEYGLEAIKERAPGRGGLMSYEKTGYDASVKGRMPDLLAEWHPRWSAVPKCPGMAAPVLYWRTQRTAA